MITMVVYMHISEYIMNCFLKIKKSYFKPSQVKCIYFSFSTNKYSYISSYLKYINCAYFHSNILFLIVLFI